MKKINLVAVLVLVLLMNIVTVSANSDEEKEKKIKNQHESLKAYSSIIENSTSESYDELGGFFIDEYGILCVNIVKGKNKPNIVNFEKNVKYIEVDNSLTSLNGIVKDIGSQFERLKDSDIDAFAYYISNKENKVILEVRNLKEAKKNDYLSHFDSSILKLVETDETDIIEETNVLSGKKVVVGNYGGTVGFCAKKYMYYQGYYQWVEGIVTSGHYPNIQIGTTAKYNGSSSVCGQVIYHKNSGDVDASFIGLNSSYDATGYTIGNTIKGKMNAVEGLAVKLYGKDSGISYGEVKAVGITAGNNSDMLRCDYSSQGGDSGGTVGYYESVLQGDIVVGIHESASTDYTYAIQVNNIFDEFNLNSIITD